MNMNRMEATTLGRCGGAALLMLALLGCTPTRTGKPVTSQTPPPANPTPVPTNTVPYTGAESPDYTVVTPIARDTDLTADLNEPSPTSTANAQTLVREARAKLDAGDADAALPLFEQAIRENPKLLDAHLGIGQIYHKKGDFHAAAQAYEQAAQIAPTSFDAHYYLALMRQLQGQFDLAVKAYLYALAINPSNYQANQDLASCYLQMGRPAEAVPYARRATELKPREQSAWANLGAAYSLMNLYDKAVRAYREANELGDLQEPIVLGLAESHNRLGNFDRAIAVLEVALKKFPSNLSHERMGYALFKKRQYAQALQHFRAALLFDPNDAAALNGLGVCLMTTYIQTERQSPLHKEEALAAWERSMELAPNQPKIAGLLQKFRRL